MHFHQELIKLLEQATQLKEEEIEQLLSVPPDSKLGDYAFPCFKLQCFSGNPKEKAEQLKAKIEEILQVQKEQQKQEGQQIKKQLSFISKTEVAGPYLNFFLNQTVLAEKTLKEIYKEAKWYGKTNLGKGKKIVIDFSAPNIAKPFGIGHLRSTVIGHCLYHVFEYLGYKVIGVNHLGDWGTQFGKLIVAYKKWGSKEELQKEPIPYLLKLYVKFHEEAEKNEDLNELARAEFKNLEDGDKEALALWEAFKEVSLKEFQRIYDILEVKFDSYEGEAFYNNLLNSTITELEKNKNVPTEISDSALVVDLKKFNMPPVLLRKTNGSTSYHTRDLAAAFYRLKKYKPEKIIYVVGMEQKLHFQQLFKVLEFAGVDKDKFIHVDFGLFMFPEGKMSTRKGQVIFLEEVLNKAIALIREIIEQKNPDLKNKEDSAKHVGVGAIIFADLSTDRIRNIDFDWNRMLSFEGETGPYLQYTHARACSILRKAKHEHKLTPNTHVNFSELQLPVELAVVKLLSAFPEAILKTAEMYKPHILAHHLLSLAQAFNEFYHQCPVLSGQLNLSKARLLLVDCVRQVLANGLELLGMKAVEEM